MKKSKIMLLVVLILLIIAIVVNIFRNNENMNKFLDMNGDEGMETAYNAEETRHMIDFLKSGTGIVYFYFNECDWCKRTTPVFKEALKKAKYEGEVIYYNPYYIRKNNTEEYQEVVEILKDILSADENGNKKLYVPEVVFVKDGKIIGHQTNNVESYTNNKVEMTEDEIWQLNLIYTSFMDRLADKSCTTCN